MVASFDCRSPYDPAAYAAAALEERLEETRTVYANVFFGVGVGAAANGYLACGTSTGTLSVFNVDHLLAGGPESDVAPALVLPAHKGAVYSLVVHADDGILCSGGDDGRTAVWRVDALVAAADGDDEKKDARPAAAFVNPQRGLPRGALGAIPETNALAYDGVRGVLFAAAGDGVCYGWDVREARARRRLFARARRRRAAALRGGARRRRRERNGGDRLGGRDRAHLGRATGGGVACREPVRRDECLSRCLSRCLSVSGDRGVRVSD